MNRKIHIKNLMIFQSYILYVGDRRDQREIQPKCSDFIKNYKNAFKEYILLENINFVDFQKFSWKTSRCVRTTNLSETIQLIKIFIQVA